MYKDLNCSNCKNARLSDMKQDGHPGIPGLLYCSRISEQPCLAAKVPSRNWCSWHDYGAPQKGPEFEIKNTGFSALAADENNPQRLVNLRRQNRLRKLLRQETRMAKAWDSKYTQTCMFIEMAIQADSEHTVMQQRRVGDFVFKRCTRAWNRVEALKALLALYGGEL